MSHPSLLIANPTLVAEKVIAMQEKGADGLHILADFDSTLTKSLYQWDPVPSIISLLYTGDYLSDAYRKEAKTLADHYYPIEMDHSIAAMDKKVAMVDWWEKHLELLIQSKLSLRDIERLVTDKRLQLRDKTMPLFQLLQENAIPLIIISASGIGGDSIGLFLNNNKLLFDNICIVWNTFMRDKTGYAIGRNLPLIHSLNKSEVVLIEFSAIYAKIQDRKNVILLGDSPHDVDMMQWIDHDVCIKIWFCNDNTPEKIQLFSSLYDVVILDDGDMGYPLELLKNICI